MTTGLAIATPQDNGAVWAIAQNMRSQAAAWQTVASGLNRAQSIVDVAASGASNIANILNSVKADALSLSDTSLDANSQATLMANIQQLVSQIDQVASSATFDGVNLLVPITEPPIPLSFPSGGPNPTLSFTSAVNGQPGIINMGFSFYNVDPATPSAPTLNSAMYVALPTTSGQTTTLSASFPYGDWSNFSATNPSSVSFDFATNQFPTPAPPAPPPPAAYGVTVQSLTLTPFRTEETVAASPDGATDSLYYQPMTSDWLGLSDLNSMTPGQILSAVNSAISQVTANAQQIGDQQDMLTNQVNVANTMQDTITTGVGNLVDANMATESANLQAEKVKQQLATKALSIANAEPQMLLSLFR